MERWWNKLISAVCAGVGVLCLAGLAAVCCRLSRGTVGDGLAVAAVLVLLAVLAMLLLWKEGVSRERLLLMLLPVCAAMLFRALCLDFDSGDYNSFLTHWYAYFKENGGFAAIADSIGDYNVPYLNFMAAISYLNLPDLYLIKLFSILFDVLLAWGGFRLTSALRGEREGDYVPLVAFALLMFLPTVVLNGALWGQCDAIYGALVVHGVAQVLKGRNRSSVALMAVAFSFKLQTIFVLPLWGVLWLARKVRFRELLIFPLTYVITILPALLLGKPLSDILGVYFNQMGEYSSLTLSAPSVFQLIPYGMEVNDGLLSGLGVAAAVVLVLALLAAGWRLRGRLNREAVFAMAVVLAIGVPFFLPHMHERYFFLADVLTLCWACANLRRVPAAVLTCASSLACYIVYLRLRYTFVLTIGGYRFVMLPEMLAMLAALIFALTVMMREVACCFRGKEKTE